MATVAQTQAAIRAPVKFAANHDEFAFSNYDPSLVSIELAANEVELRNARKLPVASSLDAEGFELHELPFEDQNLLDPDWVKDVYGPRIVEYLKQITGAAAVFPFRGHRVLIRDAGAAQKGRAVVADYVHIDQSEVSGQHHVQRDSEPEIYARYPHARIINVWRPLTQPPQDMPLAMCDQRTLDKADWVLGKTREPGVDYATDTYASLYNPDQEWYYFPDMTPDEMIVFKAWDSDANGPIGCLHGAFRDPSVPAGTTPRISAESRYICFFES